MSMALQQKGNKFVDYIGMCVSATEWLVGMVREQATLLNCTATIVFCVPIFHLATINH